jgi:uncharacterized protein (DUF1499 family)
MKGLEKKLALLGIAVSITGCSGARPKFVGDAKLAPCPQTPNCVCTEAADSNHAIMPLTYTTSREEAMAQLIAVINSLPRTNIVAQTDDYLYAEFTSLVCQFVDDVEFIFSDKTKTIQFRSASRLGKNDLGMNRQRMEEIRKLFNKSNAPTAPGAR